MYTYLRAICDRTVARAPRTRIRITIILAFVAVRTSKSSRQSGGYTRVSDSLRTRWSSNVPPKLVLITSAARVVGRTAVPPSPSHGRCARARPGRSRERRRAGTWWGCAARGGRGTGTKRFYVFVVATIRGYVILPLIVRLLMSFIHRPFSRETNRTLRDTTSARLTNRTRNASPWTFRPVGFGKSHTPFVCPYLLLFVVVVGLFFFLLSAFVLLSVETSLSVTAAAAAILSAASVTWRRSYDIIIV